ncbi:peptidase M16 [Clostridia bacterium]|nr:peptidase M16 [Clostridia bacterium]
MKREELLPGVHFTAVSDGRYKKNTISVNFIARLSEETAGPNALIPMLLSKSNRNLPTLRDLNKRLGELYSASLSYGGYAYGDAQVLNLSVTAIDDKYALAGEPLLRDASRILLDCLFMPVLEAGVFEKDSVELEKQSLIDEIEADDNDKRVFALHRTREIMCEGEPAAIGKAGKIENVRKITPAAAFEAYGELLRTAAVEIIAVGRNPDFKDAKSEFHAAFKAAYKGLTREISDTKSVRTLPKSDTREKTENQDIAQSKLVIGFKSKTEQDESVMVVVNKILGGSPTSKLFRNVREKLSLCYYCASRFVASKTYMLIDSGVESENITKAKDEILRQFAAVQKGEITDDEMLHAKLSLENDLQTVGDSASATSSWYLNRIYAGEIYSPEEAIVKYLKVTLGEIAAAASALTLDTVYLLTGLAEKDGV